MNINAIQDEIIDEFSRFEGWFDKYEHLVKAGQYLPHQDKYLKIERNQIHGCQSKVWLSAERKDDKVYFTTDSDALITKGILALLLRVSIRARFSDWLAASRPVPASWGCSLVESCTLTSEGGCSFCPPDSYSLLLSCQSGFPRKSRNVFESQEKYPLKRGHQYEAWRL